jgi:hypothetical protein
MGKKITKDIFLERVKSVNETLFSNCDYTNTVYINISTQVSVVCKFHGEFKVWPGDHMKGMSGCKQCISEKRKQTNVKKYGVDNYFKRVDLVEQAMMLKHGVKNPGLMDNHVNKIISTNLIKHGTKWAATSQLANTKRIETNIKRYGVSHPFKNKNVVEKMLKTKVSKGGFSQSNSSKSATSFIKQYIDFKQYSIDQCAFDSKEHNLFEWGMFYKGKWRLFDLVVFDKGHRGDLNHIVEILEYHGPFHYTLEDCKLFGDKKAYPWNSKKITVKESFEIDKIKEELALKLTKNFYIVWEKDLNPNDVIAENVTKLQSRYPSGSFDPWYSENRKEGDL